MVIASYTPSSLELVRLLHSAPRPHVVFILADDYGWANMGKHRKHPQGAAEAGFGLVFFLVCVEGGGGCGFWGFGI